MNEAEPPEAGPDADDDADAAASMTAASRSMIGERDPLMRTGFFKPLPTTGRVRRIWTAWGLLAGRRLSTVIGDDHIYLILMAAVVGTTSGAAAALLLTWIEFANDMFLADGEGWWRVLAIVGLPALGGLGAGAVRVLRDRLGGSSAPIVGPAGVITAITQRGGKIDGSQGIANGIGTGLSIGSGGACGHEGPSVAIGATVGAVVAQFFGLRLRRQVALVGAGCAGGLAAAFNAPLAGVIFTVELVFGGAIGGNIGTMSVFIPLIVAAVTGTFTSHAIFGPHTEFEISSHKLAALPEYGFYVLLAVAAGLLGVGMARAIIFATGRFDGLDRFPPWLRPALGGLAVGVIALAVSPDLLGTGHSVVDAALHGELLWQGALLLVATKIVVSAITLGSGGYGGAFMPSLMVGACLGTLVGALAHAVLGDAVQNSSAYALVGMGAVFAGLMQAPLTPIVMLFELTNDYAIILPLMLSCILAVLVSRRLADGGLYRQLLRYRGVILEHEAEGEVMKRGLVRDLMQPAEQVLTPGAALAEVRAATIRAHLGSIYVVDGEGEVLGFLSGQQLARRMLDGQIEPESTAADLMGRNLTLLYDDDTLAGAMLAFARSDQDILPVVDRGRRLQGVLHRSHVLKHYSDNVLGRQQEVVQVSAGGRPDQEVGLGRGIVLERVCVGRRWAGRSLTELQLRNKSGVVVMEWRRGEEVVPIDPAAPLREGDIVALVGTREQILAARQLW